MERKMMTTNLEYYKVFYYVAVCQSMTLAAERLMISQPAVSQSMRQLEKALDTKLMCQRDPPDPGGRNTVFLYQTGI